MCKSAKSLTTRQGPVQPVLLESTGRYYFKSILALTDVFAQSVDGLVVEGEERRSWEIISTDEELKSLKVRNKNFIIILTLTPLVYLI